MEITSLSGQPLLGCHMEDQSFRYAKWKPTYVGAPFSRRLASGEGGVVASRVQTWRVSTQSLFCAFRCLCVSVSHWLCLRVSVCVSAFLCVFVSLRLRVFVCVGGCSQVELCIATVAFQGCPQLSEKRVRAPPAVFSSRLEKLRQGGGGVHPEETPRAWLFGLQDGKWF